MNENQIGPISLNERIELVDVLRGLAVGGILIGNMQWFSGYGQMPPSIEAQAPLIDQITHFLIHVIVEGKFYSIFSFLFGFGFALQIARAEERGDANASVFKRRLMWLFVIGVLHATLIWAGDILSVYAVTGFILLLFRKKSDKSLLKWVVGLLFFPVVTYSLLYAAFVTFAPPGTYEQIEAGMADAWRKNIVDVGQGNYFSIVTGYNLQYLAGRWIGLFFQMRFPKILAMFLLGVYAYRQGFLRDVVANRTFINKVLVYGLVLGLIGNLIMAWLAGNEAPPPSAHAIIGVAGYAFGVPALALGIIALVTVAWQQEAGRRILSSVTPVGRMALTNYLMQSVICVVIFYGYGFGLFGRYGAAISTAIALAIFAFQIVVSSIWLRYFAFGPMEWVWRQLTYRKRLSLRPAES
jgi:uncharacterized protein